MSPTSRRLVAGAKFGDVQAEFLRQRQHHGGADGPVVVFHLVEIGQGHAQLVRKMLLRQPMPLRNSRSLAPA